MVIMVMAIVLPPALRCHDEGVDVDDDDCDVGGDGDVDDVGDDGDIDDGDIDDVGGDRKHGWSLFCPSNQPPLTYTLTVPCHVEGFIMILGVFFVTVF